MKHTGVIAIVGRPNVGKSTIFNRLAGSRISIVEDTPGVTRDRIYAKGSWLGREFPKISRIRKKSGLRYPSRLKKQM